MMDDNIDKIVKKVLDKRTIKPSNSAWERLSMQLEDHEGSIKKDRTRKIGWYVASIALILSIGGVGVYNHTNRDYIEPIIVDMRGPSFPAEEAPLDLDVFRISRVDFVIEKKNIEKRQNKMENNSMEDAFSPSNITSASRELISAKNKEPIVVPNQKIESSSPFKEQRRVVVRGEDLLYAVTHSEEKVKEYYAKHKLERAVILKTIDKELNRIHLEVRPEVILAEVEQEIINDGFQGNFMDMVKDKISDIAIAIAERNK